MANLCNELGRPPRPRSSVFCSSGSTDSSATGLGRLGKVGYLCISPLSRDVDMITKDSGRALRTAKSNLLNNLLSNMAEFHKQPEAGEPRNGQRGANSRTSVPELDEVRMWSAPTSNVRGVDEADEMAAAGPSALANFSRFLAAHTSKGRPQVCQSFWTTYIILTQL